MRPTSLLMILICTPLWAASSGYAAHGGEAKPVQPAQAALELTTSVTGQRYCGNPDPVGISSLRFDLRLRYRNIGEQPIILYKGSNRPHRQLVSASVEDATRNRYLFDISPFITIEEDLPTISSSTTPDKTFVVLRPGATFETMVAGYSTVAVKRSDEERTDEPDILGTGEYVMQVEVSTFPFPKELEAELQLRWKASGGLSVGSVRSRPMTFRVEKDRKFVDCDR